MTVWDRIWCVALCSSLIGAGDLGLELSLSNWPNPLGLLVPLIVLLEYVALLTASAPGFTKRGFKIIFDAFAVSATATVLLVFTRNTGAVTVLVACLGIGAVALGAVALVGSVVWITVKLTRRY